MSSSRRSDVARYARFVLGMLRSPSQRKHILRWLRSLREDFLIDEPSPWITFGAIDFIESFIARQSEPVRVFEYGSGGSTLYWQERAAFCVSIEHDRSWHDAIRSRIHLERVDHRLIPPEKVEGGACDPADPLGYASADVSYEGCSFRRYASVIDEFDDATFHIVLIDGRARPSCLMHAAPKVRPGGILILDNADRDYYTSQAQRYLTGYGRVTFVGALPTLPVVDRTDVFIRQSVDRDGR